MVLIPALKNGPFGLDLEKSVRYIITIYKGVSIGVIVSSLLAILIQEINLATESLTDDQASSIKEQILLGLCACAFALAYFFLCRYLFKGVEERNRTWIFPWFLVTAIVAIVLIIIFFYSMNYGFNVIQIVLPLIIIKLVFYFELFFYLQYMVSEVVFMFYCVLLVYSFYVDLGVNFVPEPPTQVVPS